MNNSKRFDILKNKLNPDVITVAMQQEINDNISGKTLERHSVISEDEIIDLRIIIKTLSGNDDVLEFLEKV